MMDEQPSAYRVLLVKERLYRVLVSERLLPNNGPYALFDGIVVHPNTKHHRQLQDVIQRQVFRESAVKEYKKRIVGNLRI